MRRRRRAIYQEKRNKTPISKLPGQIDIKYDAILAVSSSFKYGKEGKKEKPSAIVGRLKSRCRE